MNISNLIQKLEQMKAEHGDLPIAVKSEHCDTFEDGAVAWIGYAPKEDNRWGWELACDGEDYDSLTDEELERDWGVQDRDSIEKVLMIT